MSTVTPVDFLLERFSMAPEAVAFIDDGVPYTYGWILNQLPVYEAYLDRVGVRAGEVVVLVADYSPEVYCLLLAAIRRGVVLAPLTRQSIVELDTVLEISQCQWVLEVGDGLEDCEVTRHDRVVANPLLAGLASQSAPGLLLFTSGSTGQPKGILHDARRLLRKFEAQRPPVVAISFLMLDHFGGINTLLHITSGLGTVVTVPERTIGTICRAVQDHRVELLPTTPSFLNMLVHSEAVDRYDLSSLRVISYGTEVMPQPTLDRLLQLFPDVKLQQTYGLSEVGVLRSASRPDGSLWFTIGGAGFETKVVDDVLWIRSEYAMLGYLNAPSPFDDEGWFNTQDRVQVDGDHVKILGRTSDLMNIGGQKVYPSEIEDVVIALDNIADAAVFAEPHALLGQIVVVSVALRSPESAADLRKRVRKACSAVLAPYKVPSKVVIADGDLYSARLKKVRASRIT